MQKVANIVFSLIFLKLEYLDTNRSPLFSGQTELLLDQGRNIQYHGAGGAFDKEFRVMEDNLEEIKKIIDNAGVSTIDVEELENLLKEIRYSDLF